MIGKEELEALFVKHGYEDYKWIKSDQIKVAQWVRFKCLFGCPMYGKRGTCPPHTPPIDQCREFFLEFNYPSIITWTNVVIPAIILG